MSKKHIIRYSCARPTRMNFCEFGGYRDQTGRIRNYVDINGIEQGGFKTTQPNIKLDLTLEHEKLVDDFLVDHPLVKAGKWKRIDTFIEDGVKGGQIDYKHLAGFADAIVPGTRQSKQNKK